MIESIFTRSFTIKRHLNAPCLEEREIYLRHLQASGRKVKQLKWNAESLLQIVRIMELTQMRPVDEDEIRAAAIRWASEPCCQRNRKGLTSLAAQAKSSADRFRYRARDWMRFHNCLIKPVRPHRWFDPYLDDFRQAASSRGLGPVTCYEYTYRVETFFEWLSTKRTSIQEITISDFDEFVDERTSNGFSPLTIDGECTAIRAFFRYGETRNWCQSGFSRILTAPLFRKQQSECRGPSWRDVRRLISSCNRGTPSDIRAKAVLLLCSVYGLRQSEITRLCLNDLDWRNETLTVRRAKRGGIQQFPLQYEVGEAIIDYLRRVRPRSSYRNLFLSQNSPYRPMRTLFAIISRRMRALKIRSRNIGAHSLRHACATELLRKGASIPEIADFLGHRGLAYVSVYAKNDMRSMREVANISLHGVL